MTAKVDFVRLPDAGKIYFVTSSFCGAIAQMGERVVRNDEAVGSIPTSSTIYNSFKINSFKNSACVLC
jgi:hypothetical protein